MHNVLRCGIVYTTRGSRSPHRHQADSPPKFLSLFESPAAVTIWQRCFFCVIFDFLEEVSLDNLDPNIDYAAPATVLLSDGCSIRNKYTYTIPETFIKNRAENPIRRSDNISCQAVGWGRMRVRLYRIVSAFFYFRFRFVYFLFGLSGFSIPCSLIYSSNVSMLAPPVVDRK